MVEGVAYRDERLFYRGSIEEYGRGIVLVPPQDQEGSLSSLEEIACQQGPRSGIRYGAGSNQETLKVCVSRLN